MFASKIESIFKINEFFYIFSVKFGDYSSNDDVLTVLSS